MKSPPRRQSQDLPTSSEDVHVQTGTDAENVPDLVPVDPLRGVRSGSGTTKAKSTEMEFSRLKNLVPSIAKKSTVSKLDVILEAIRYIDELQDQLYEQVQERKINPALAVNLLLAGGKENTININTSVIKNNTELSGSQH